MKPATTWIVLANARQASVIVHTGLCKGLHVLGDVTRHASDAPLPRDKAGVGQSIGGPVVSAVEQTDQQAIADAAFAKLIGEQLQQAKARQAFDRLIIAAGPRILGLLWAALGADLNAVLLGEISKDLSDQPLQQIEACLGEIFAV